MVDKTTWVFLLHNINHKVNGLNERGRYKW